jgi:hypothetical protein
VAKKREEREPGGADSSPAEADPIRAMSDREKLQLRTWLLHWSLFCYQGPPERVADKWCVSITKPTHWACRSGVQDRGGRGVDSPFDVCGSLTFVTWLGAVQGEHPGAGVPAQ